MTKPEIISKLQNEIYQLQGFKPLKSLAVELPFPFPAGALHEFICEKEEDSAATSAFLSGVLGILMRNQGITVWISTNKKIFPPALKAFGVTPDKIIFIDPKKNKDVLWATEEALKSNGLAAVVAELPDFNFVASRKLQLAIEQSRITGLIIRPDPRQLTTNACTCRWKITSLPSVLLDDLPGVGFPRWQAELLKTKNGKPASWQLEWRTGKFKLIKRIPSIRIAERKKTG